MSDVKMILKQNSFSSEEIIPSLIDSLRRPVFDLLFLSFGLMVFSTLSPLQRGGLNRKNSIKKICQDGTCKILWCQIYAVKTWRKTFNNVSPSLSLYLPQIAPNFHYFHKWHSQTWSEAIACALFDHLDAQFSQFICIIWSIICLISPIFADWPRTYNARAPTDIKENTGVFGRFYQRNIRHSTSNLWI